MHNIGGTQHFRASNSSQRKYDQKLELKQEYYKNHSNFAPRQQDLRDKLMLKRQTRECLMYEKLLRSGLPIDLRESGEKAIAFMLVISNYVPGLAGKTTALLLTSLIMSECWLGSANATSTISSSSSGNDLNGQSSAEKRAQVACTQTDLLPANKHPGTQMHAQYDQASKKYTFAEKFLTPVSKKELKKLTEKKDNREKTFDDQDLRGKAVVTQQTTFDKMVSECSNDAKVKLVNLVQKNVLNQIVNEKLYTYQNIKEIYDAQNTELIGNCHEMTWQACLLVMPELIPDEEFFVEVVATNQQSGVTHVYGLIVPRNLLQGEGLTTSAKAKTQFTNKFSHPFFDEGNAYIKMGTTDLEQKRNTALFWQALGFSNGQVKNQEVSNQSKLCDPYNGAGLYCDLEQCFSDQQTAQTYTLALETITEIKIHTWVIPRELKPKMNDFVKCANESINQKILTLIEDDIKPAAIKIQKKMAKSEL